MYTFTITGNTWDELLNNIKALPKNQTVTPTPLPAGAAFAPPLAPLSPEAPPPVNPTAGVVAPQTPAGAPAALPPTAFVAPAAAQGAMPPTSAPTYSLDALARAGATLAQSGKMQEALALLARYGVQTVNQLKPEQYGAFATELRALGAQV